jgi:hypothetical protein
MISLSTTQVRNLLQLPERPYEDTRFFDGSKFYDLERYEIVRILSMSGTASGSSYLFRNGLDFNLNYDSIDFTGAAVPPDINTAFTTDYTYSRLGSSLASSAVANAILITTFDLGAKYPYASTSIDGINTDQLATFVCAFKACAEITRGMSVSEIELAQKVRRGSVLFDDSKKTSDFLDETLKWEMHYKKYLSMVRPLGMIRGFNLIRPVVGNLVLGEAGRFAFDGLFDGVNSISGEPFGGAF